MKNLKSILRITEFGTKISLIVIIGMLMLAGCKKDKTDPTVISIDPIDNATEVVRNKVISVQFSEEMDLSTINSSTFILKQGLVPVEGEISYSGTMATFTPASFLDANSNYTVKITSGVKSVKGNSLVKTTSVSFKTSGTTGPDNSSGLSAVNLGAAGGFVILAKTAINNNPTSNITGDLGLSPAATSYVTGLSLTNATGYATSSQVTGKIYAADMTSPTPINLTTAVNNMITAYNDAAGRPSPDFSELGAGNIGGKTLSAGLYKWTNTVSAPTNVTISGEANDVWIFQIAGDLTISSAVNITLIGGAQAKNVFWQVAGEVTIGTNAKFQGIIMSQTGITFGTGATLQGKALAQSAVILDSNVISNP